MNQIYKIAKRYGKGNRARTCAAAFLAALALTGVMGMSEAQASTVTGDDGQIGGVVINHGIYYKNTSLRDGSLFVGDNQGHFSQISPESAKLGNVKIDKEGKITGVAAGAVTAGSTDAVNGSQIHAVATEAAKHSKVVNGSNIKVEEAEVNGQKIYKVGLNDNVLLGKPTGNNVSLSGTNGTIETTGSITTKDSISAANGAQLADIKVSGNVISNGKAAIALYGDSGIAGMMNGKGASIYMQDGNTVINSKVAIDKDGKVTATAGEIGGVTINKGISYKNTSLRDGSLFVGDDKGNYSQISPEYAKLGNTTANTLNAKYNLSVGKMAENGTMPFFVNSTGDFYAANNKFSVGKDGKVTATAGEIGGVTINKGIFYKNTALRDGELFVGDASGNYSQITTKGAKLGKVTVAEDGKITGVAAGAVTAGSTDAVNGSQLHAVATEAAKHSKVVNGSNIKVEEAEVNGQKIYKVGLNDDVLLGKLTGNNVSLSGTNGTIETTGYIATKDRIIADKGAQLAGINVSGNIISNGAAKIALYGDSGVAGMVNGKGASIYMQDGNTIINSKVAIDKDGKITGVAAGAVTAGSTDAVNGGQLHAVAADVAQNKADIAQNKADIAQNKADIAQNKADIAQNKADIAQNKADIAQNKTDIAQNKADIAQNKADIGKLDNRVTNVENLARQHTTVEAGNNITVTESTNTNGGKKYTVGMAKDITVDSVKVGDKTYVSKDGLNANNQTITNVKDGKIEEGSKDAVNGGQLYATNQLVKDNASNISLLGNSINKLNNRVDKVGAGAAALAALHPLDFDPEDKWDFAAGYGNYSGASAVALGAYYRPNEDTMFSVGGSFGNGENMVNAGVSLKLGQSNHAPASKAAMEKKISALSQEVEELKAAIADLRAAQTKAKDAQKK